MPILGGCLCFDLPTGSKLIGAIYLFCAIIGTLSLTVVNIAIWATGVVVEFLKFLEASLRELEREHKENQFDEDYKDPFEQQNEEQIKLMREFVDTFKDNIDTAKILMLVLLCLSFLSIITSSMLIHGVRKRVRGFLLPWVIQEMVHIILGISIAVLGFIIFGTAQQAWLTALPIVFTIFIEIYFIIVVISQYQALELIRMQDEMCMK